MLLSSSHFSFSHLPRLGFFALSSAFLSCFLLEACGSEDNPSSVFEEQKKDAAIDVESISFEAGSSDVTLNANSSCATGVTETTRLPLYLEIVFDGSSSMDSDNKWPAAKGALRSLIASFAQNPDPKLAVGFIFFCGSNDPSCAGSFSYVYPNSSGIPIGFVDTSFQTKVDNHFLSAAPSGPTPMLHALTGAYQELQNYTPSAPVIAGGKKVVVLITDGQPTDGSPISEGKAQVLSLVTQKASTLETFVIGVGPFPSPDTQTVLGYDPLFLAQLAVAGKTAQPGCDPSVHAQGQEASTCHFQLTPGSNVSEAELRTKLLEALEKVRSYANACDLQIVKKPELGTIDPTLVNVLYDNGSGTQAVIPKDDVNGWSFDNPNAPEHVLLHGLACNKAKTEPNSKFEVLLGCQSIGR